MLITVNQWNLAIGLKWQIPKSRNEVAQAKGANKGKGYVLAKTDHMQWLGIHDEVGGNYFAGALLIGLIHPNAIVIHPLPNGMAWICALQDGMPIVGRDLVLGLDDANGQVRQWLGRADNYVVVGDVSQAVDTVESVLDKVKVASESSGDIRKQVKTATLAGTTLSVSSLIKPAMAVATIAVSVVAAYALIYSKPTTSSNVVQSETAQAEAASAQAQASAMQVKEHNLAIQRQQVSEMIEQYRNRMSPIALWSAAAGIRAQMPVSMNGFRPIKFDCTPAECQVMWRGQGRLVQLSDKLLLPNVTPNYSDSLEAISSFAVEKQPDVLPQVSADNVEQFSLLVRSDIRARYPAAQVSEIKPVMVTPPAATGIPPAPALHAGTWQIQFNGPTALASATALVAYIQAMPMTLTSIKYDPQASRVELAGEYVALPKI